MLNCFGIPFVVRDAPLLVRLPCCYGAKSPASQNIVKNMPAEIQRQRRNESGHRRQMRSRTHQERQSGERDDGWIKSPKTWKSWRRPKFEEHRDEWSLKLEKLENKRISKLTTR